MNRIRLIIIFLCFFLYASSISYSQNKDIQPKMVMGDTANSAWLQGEARRLRENCESLKKKGNELVATYKSYIDRTKNNCQGAYEEAKKAYDMAKRAVKFGEQGIKLSHKAEKTNKMKKAKNWLNQIERKRIAGSEYLRESEHRKKEVEFELRGC